MHALSRAVVEIEQHVSAGGWDQPAQLFALVPTAELLAAEPGLDVELSGELTPVAQEGLSFADDDLATALVRIEWPDAVTGCALAVERIVLPSESAPLTPREAAADPRRHDVRMVAGVLRDGERFGAVRLREHDEDSAVLTGTDLVPTLCDVLALTFAPDSLVGTADDEEKEP